MLYITIHNKLEWIVRDRKNISITNKIKGSLYLIVNLGWTIMHFVLNMPDIFLIKLKKLSLQYLTTEKYIVILAILLFNRETIHLLVSIRQRVLLNIKLLYLFQNYIESLN